MHPVLKQIFSYTLRGEAIPLNQIEPLLHLLPPLHTEFLLDIMSAARIQASCYSGSLGSLGAPFTCGIINAKSGNCSENCSFCAQSQYHATHAQVYPRVPLDALLKKAEELANSGASYMGIVISGKSPLADDFDFFCAAAEAISKKVNIKLCASFGIISRSQALALREAGFSSYHHNLETSRSFFPFICTTHTYDSRIETIKNARAAGLRICSGGVFGLGESWKQRMELAMTLKELAVDSIPINFLTAIAGTPLAGQLPLSPNECLSIISLMRLIHPLPDIIICGGRKSILQEWEKLIFSAGANGLMTGNYLTTTGGELESDSAMMRILGVRQ